MVGAPAAVYYKRAALGLISVSGLVCGTVAQAGDWTITPSVAVSEEFTDNSRLTRDSGDRNSDFVTTVSPGLSIQGTGGRTSLNLNYNFNQSYYSRGTRPDKNSNILAAAGQVELWKRFVFVDTQASISQVLGNNTETTSNSISGQNVNRREARSFNVSPYFRYHFGQWMESEARTKLNQVSTNSNNVQNTSTRTDTLNINSGRRFAVFPWSVIALNQKTQYHGDRPSTSERRVDTNLSYVLDRKLILTGGIGWEDIENPRLNSQPTGMTWSGGFTLRPNLRTSLQFSGGVREDRSNFSLNTSHDISSRSSVRASYSKSIQTSQRQISNGLNFLGTDSNTGELIDTRTGLAPTGDTLFGLSDDTFRQQVLLLNFNGSRRRNAFNGGVRWEERKTELTGIKRTSYAGNFGISRAISPRLKGGLNLVVSTTDFGTADNREDIKYSGATSLSYQVRNDIQATMSYNLTLTKVNNAPGDVLENAVSLRLTKSF